jgi:xanthine dehydrogenase accessory factor
VEEVIASLNEALQRHEPVAVATVVETQGASPVQPGFKLLARPDGSIIGNVGGGALEKRVRDDVVAALQKGQSRLAHYRLREEGPDAIGMLCGGEVTVFIEVYQAPPELLIVGGGHVGEPLADMARTVGFHVRVVDVRPERATVPQLDPSTITAQTFVVLITEDHVTDEQALRQVLCAPAAYIGMIGSQRKTAAVLDHLRADKVAEDQLARVHAPIGLDLGGRSPAEIALAILAEIVQVRYGGSGKRLSLHAHEALAAGT